MPTTPTAPAPRRLRGDLRHDSSARERHPAGREDRHEGAIVTPQCFEVLGLSAHAGRLIGQNPSGTPEVVISYTLWNRELDADPAAIGSGILLNGISATIVGVAPRGFHGTSLDGSADFWVGADGFASLLPPAALRSRRYRSFSVFARLRDGVTTEQADAALAGVAAGLHRLDPAAWSDASGAPRRVTVSRELDSRFGDTPGGIALLLLTAAGAIAVIVAIACVNVATMLLARGAARTRELTIRLALGASRARILRQLATESFLIALAGAGAALAALSAGIRLFEARRPDGLPAVDLAIDWRVAMFALVAAISTLSSAGAGRARRAPGDRRGMKGRVAVRWFRAALRGADRRQVRRRWRCCSCRRCSHGRCRPARPCRPALSPMG